MPKCKITPMRTTEGKMKRQKIAPVQVKKLVMELNPEDILDNDRTSGDLTDSERGEVKPKLLYVSNSPAHMPERPEGATSNNRCVVCSEKYKRAKRANPDARAKDLPKRSKTVYWCKSCEVYLCIGSGIKNCFEVYHAKLEFWQ